MVGKLRSRGYHSLALLKLMVKHHWCKKWLTNPLQIPMPTTTPHRLAWEDHASWNMNFLERQSIHKPGQHLASRGMFNILKLQFIRHLLAGISQNAHQNHPHLFWAVGDLTLEMGAALCFSISIPCSTPATQGLLYNLDLHNLFPFPLRHILILYTL